MTQATDDWNSFLEETAADSDSSGVTFPLTPDESVENPEAHVQKVRFSKTPAFLWMLTTGGFVGFVLLVYAATAYISGSRQVVAAPSDENVFEESNKGSKEFLQQIPDESDLQPIAPPAQAKPGKVSRAANLKQPRAAAPQPARVVYMNRPSQSYSPVREPRRSFAAVSPVSSVARPVSLRPLQRPVPEVSPEPLPEPIGALYAPESGEGPQVDTSSPVEANTVASASANPAIDQALAIYDGIDTSAPVKAAETTAIASTPTQAKFKASEVETAPAEPVYTPSEVQTTASVPVEQPLTSADYAKKYPQKAAQETLMARLAMIPQDGKLRGQIAEMLSWASQESFPVGEEFKIKIKDDFKQFGKVLIPEGSTAYAQSQKGTAGQYIMANVTRIETPDGHSYDIAPGMLTASTSDGYIEGKLKEPRRGGGIGRVLSKVGQGILNIGVASVVPEGDEFGDRVLQSTAEAGLDTVNNAIGGSGRRQRGNVPSFYIIKPRTSVSLIANDNISLD